MSKIKTAWTFQSYHETCSQVNKRDSKIQNAWHYYNVHELFDFQNKYHDSVFSFEVWYLGFNLIIGKHWFFFSLTK